MRRGMRFANATQATLAGHPFACRFGRWLWISAATDCGRQPQLPDRIATVAGPRADALWDGLEAFPAYDDEVEPAMLRQHAATALGVEPDASGLVDHDTVGDAWERDDGRRSIIDDLIAQLTIG